MHYGQSYNEILIHFRWLILKKSIWFDSKMVYKHLLSIKEKFWPKKFNEISDSIKLLEPH